MVTDEMLNRAIEAYAKDTGAEDWQLEGWIEPAIRAALEAALSAAEPVAAMTTDYLGCEYVSMDVAGIEKIAAAHSKGPTEVVYLYAAPPAPPVAVKADLPERFEEWWAGRDSKGEKTLDYNQRKQLAWDAFYAAALSAQVQDVAGSPAIKAIAAERRRQIEKEGWTPEHDDKYTSGELLEAATCYALHNGGELDDAPGAWPWSRDFWKPTSRQRDLEKAGALIAAELDRVIRAAAPAKQEGGESKPVHNQSVENGESGDK